MKHLFLIALALWFSAAAWADTTAPDYGSWYQVEIIVFAQKQPTPSDEAWMPAPLEYPANMLAIAPASADDLRPDNLAELRQLMAVPATDAPETPPTDDNSDQYLFESKSRFRNRAPDDSTPQGADEQPPTVDNAAEQAQVTAIFNADLPRAYRALPDDALHLGGVARSIQRSTLYRMLLHVGWLQPVGAEDSADPVLIQAGERYGDAWEVDGSLSVSRSRFLHVDTDLWYTQFASKYEEQTPLPAIVSDISPEARAQFPDLVTAAERSDNYVKVQTWRMKLSRRMRSATLHYLDNPYFGVLVQVDEFNYSPPANAQSGAPSPSP